MELECKSVKEYLNACNLEMDLPDIKMCLFEGVYSPRLESFLIAEELVKVVKKGHKILDIGTGSGILAILAAKKGAFAIATDIDESSIKCAEYNASLNSIKLDTRVGNLFEPIKDEELFDIIVSNMPSLPIPPNVQLDEYVTRTSDGGPNGRKYLNLLIHQMPKHLKEKGCFLTVHSNFANIEKTKDMLEELGFQVELKVNEYPIGEPSGQKIAQSLMYLPKNCQPFKKGDWWYQKMGIFRAGKSALP